MRVYSPAGLGNAIFFFFFFFQPIVLLLCFTRRGRLPSENKWAVLLANKEFGSVEYFIKPHSRVVLMLCNRFFSVLDAEALCEIILNRHLYSAIVLSWMPMRTSIKHAV